jgi:hypothetical protein
MECAKPYLANHVIKHQNSKNQMESASPHFLIVTTTNYYLINTTLYYQLEYVNLIYFKYILSHYVKETYMIDCFDAFWPY